MLTFFYIKNEKNQKLKLYLKNYYGLGSLSIQLICKTLGYDIDIKVNEIRKSDWDRLESIIKSKYKFLLRDEAKKSILDNIQNMKDIKSYRGTRHYYGLPPNNRRTKRNAKTIGWR